MSCGHPFLNKWDGKYVCMDCFHCLNDTLEKEIQYMERLLTEREKESRTPVDEMFSLEGLSAEDSERMIGENSVHRGVTIDFLINFTFEHDCWNWTTWDVIRRIIKPATIERRIRYCELPCMSEHVGRASTFISYAQAGRWGDMVCAIAHGEADRKRRVWLDVFAVRQWPSYHPDLNFSSTINFCSSFMVVCSAREELETFTGIVDSITKIPENIRKMICFTRVWCLIEAMKAYELKIIRGVSYIMRCGRGTVNNGELHFVPSEEMLKRLRYLVDVEKAEATVASDRESILEQVRNIGVNNLNGVIRGSILAALKGLTSEFPYYAEVQNAACGDAEHIKFVMSNPNLVIPSVTSGGFILLLKDLLEQSRKNDYEEAHLDINEGYGQDGYTPLILAAQGGHSDCVLSLVKEGANVYTETPTYHTTALMTAAFNGHIEVVKILAEFGGNKLVNVKDVFDETALMKAEAAGHNEIVDYLRSKFVVHESNEIWHKRKEQARARRGKR